MNKCAFLFPGQGSQYPGMAKDFYTQYEVARQTFLEADDLLSQNFSALIFEGSEHELKLTKNSQLAIYIVSMAIYRTLEQQIPYIRPSVCAGLSLGEYTALTVADKISFKEALLLVQARAQFMHESCTQREGSMQVILGMESEKVEEIIKNLNPPHLVWVANLNCPGQVVIAGDKSGIAKGVETLLSKGAKRALPLEVSGAFHSGLMQGAQDRLEPYVRALELRETGIELVMNVPGDYVSDLEKIREYLILQVTHPVRWELGIRAMMAQKIEGFIEIGSGKTLTGMNKRIGVTAPTYSLEKTSDLEGLENFWEVHCNS